MAERGIRPTRSGRLPKLTSEMEQYMMEKQRATERKLHMKKLDLEAKLLEVELEKTKIELQDIFKDETKGLDVRFFSKNVDISELPSAYKNAKKVQEQMEEFGLGTVVDKILPYGCIMAGDWQIDAPWRRKRK